MYAENLKWINVNFISFDHNAILGTRLLPWRQNQKCILVKILFFWGWFVEPYYFLFNLVHGLIRFSLSMTAVEKLEIDKMPEIPDRFRAWSLLAIGDWGWWLCRSIVLLLNDRSLRKVSTWCPLSQMGKEHSHNSLTERSSHHKCLMYFCTHIKHSYMAV